MAEQLVCSVHQDSVQGEAHHASGAESVRVNELELEVERLASRSEHLRAQNDVLSMTLAESRALGERLAVLLGIFDKRNAEIDFSIFYLCLFMQANTNQIAWRYAWHLKEPIEFQKHLKF